MSQPKVYINILNWNSLKDTFERLESVFKLDYPHFEVIVVDNDSKDDSANKIKSIYPHLTLFLFKYRHTRIANKLLRTLYSD